MSHKQSPGCIAQRKSVIGAHNKCCKYLLCAIIKHGEAKRDFEFIGADKDRQLESLWRETKIGDFLPFREDVADEAERLLAISKANRAATQRRPGSGVVDGTNNVLFVGIQTHVRSKDEITKNRDNLERTSTSTFNPIFHFCSSFL